MTSPQPSPAETSAPRILVLHSESLEPHEPRLPTAYPYDSVKSPTGWKEVLRDIDCVVLGRPQGTWSPDTYQEVDPNNPDHRNFHPIEVQVFDPTLWDWARKRNHTLVWPILGRASTSRISSRMRKWPELEILQHALHRYEICSPGSCMPCCEECPRAPRLRVDIDRTAVRNCSDYDLKESEHQKWFEMLSPFLNPTVITLSKNTDPWIHHWPTDALLQQAELAHRPKPPSSEASVRGLRLICKSRLGQDGTALHGRIGKGSIVVLPIKLPRGAKKRDSFLHGIRLLHRTLHDLPEETTTTAPATRAVTRVDTPTSSVDTSASRQTFPTIKPEDLEVFICDAFLKVRAGPTSLTKILRSQLSAEFARRGIIEPKIEWRDLQSVAQRRGSHFALFDIDRDASLANNTTAKSKYGLLRSRVGRMKKLILRAIEKLKVQVPKRPRLFEKVSGTGEPKYKTNFHLRPYNPPATASGPVLDPTRPVGKRSRFKPVEDEEESKAWLAEHGLDEEEADSEAPEADPAG